jgi:hypothetical protein
MPEVKGNKDAILNNKNRSGFLGLYETDTSG